MDTETKMLILKTLITNVAKDYFVKNQLSAKAAYIVMSDICNEFERAVIDDIIQSTVSVETLPEGEK